MDNPAFSDQYLLSEISIGNVQAFELLMLRHEPKIFRFVTSLVKSTEVAEEITQDVFLKIWENRSSLNHIESLSAWLFSISRNHTLNVIRQMAARYAREDNYAEMSDQIVDGNDVILQKELAGSIESCLEALPPKRRVIMRLKLDGLTNDEIGDQLGISANTVKNQLAKAYFTFRQMMSGNIAVFLLLLLDC